LTVAKHDIDIELAGAAVSFPASGSWCSSVPVADQLFTVGGC
jgi:hypothetical protein